MGVIGSKVMRKLRRFNVESRAHRVLERDKPIPAPKYDSNLRDLDRALEVDPQLVEKLNKKDAELDNRLKSVYVTSEDRFIDYASMRRQEQEDLDERALPTDRTPPLEFEFGHKEPIRVAPGRCTLRQATTFLTSHYESPQLWTAEKIAEDYKLKHEVVVSILKYFKPFNVYIPDRTVKESILTQAKKQIEDINKKQIKDEST